MTERYHTEEGKKYAKYCEVNYNWASRDIVRLQDEVTDLTLELESTVALSMALKSNLAIVESRNAELLALLQSIDDRDSDEMYLKGEIY